MAVDREALISRLTAAAYVAREGGLEPDEIREIVDRAIEEAEAARPRAAEVLAAYRDRFGRAA